MIYTLYRLACLLISEGWMLGYDITAVREYRSVGCAGWQGLGPSSAEENG